MAELVHTPGEEHAGPKHDYNLVDPSPWPILAAAAAFVFMVGMVLYMHESPGGGWVVLAGIAGVVFVAASWWRDVVKESVRGEYSESVAKMLRVGMVLFILSEVLFFFAFFWAFFWSTLNPPDTVAMSWPPEGVTPVEAFGIPFFNTLLLLLSGTTVTWAHHAVREGDHKTAFQALGLTVLLGAIFTSVQIYEYVHLYHEGVTLATGTFGSTFFMATGFHGFHVLVGTIFLAVCAMRVARGQLTPERHVGFEAASWYWHFVDVVWLLLFVCIYVWGGSLVWTTTGAG